MTTANIANLLRIFVVVVLAGTASISGSLLAAPAQKPLFLGGGQPLVMLTMSRDHKLYYEAYNDASDINGDGTLDVGFKPVIDYYGYFDSYKCYDYVAADSRFVPLSVTADKKCASKWSGNFLNYLTTTRMDAMRKVLYGGYRSTDGDSITVLERSYIPQDAHSWGKEYESTAKDGYNIADYAPLSQPLAGRHHLFANTTLLYPAAGHEGPLLRVQTNSGYRVWEWLSIERPVAGDRCLNGGNGPVCTDTAGSAITDYKVRVEVCKSGLLETDCKGYPISSPTPTIYRPTGLLHEFGEDHTMAFGLLTGSYSHNLQGGVLRKNVENFANEIDASNGKFVTTPNGIVKTLDSFAITRFGGSYEYSCGWVTTEALSDGRCNMWGNPIGEMMYEVLRYYAGKSDPTPEFTYSTTTDDGLALPKPDWKNPYRAASGGYGWCSKPFQLVISDINPSYDSDQLPGSAFSTFSGDNLGGLNVKTLGKTIWDNETEASNIFIGHSLANTPPYDGAPTPKTVNSFGNIRGLAPEEPTKQGSYYSASVAYFGNITKLTNPEAIPAVPPESGVKQKVQTFAVALASPLPKIEIPVTVGGTTKTLTLVPFAKSVGGGSISIATGAFQPTNQIVDFYIDTIRNVTGFPTDNAINGGRPYYKFRINYEDVEQGADHDMDAIAEYTISLMTGGTVQVQVDSTYAAGGIMQHMGYVVSGSTADGTYLVVRDKDTSEAEDPDFALDTPNTTDPLPLTNTRVFTVGNASASFIKHDPLWYAAKWGGFNDIEDENKNVDGLPKDAAEWDKKKSNGAFGTDGTPDNYFLVTNAGRLKDQLRSAFSEIAARTASASAVAQNAKRFGTDTAIFQALFYTSDWTGNLRALTVNSDGTVNDTTPIWEASRKIPAYSSRKIFTWDMDTYAGNKFKIETDASGLTDAQLTSMGLGGTTPATEQSKFVNFLRGDPSNEQKNAGGTLRNRSTPLGDIINTDPVYVAAEDFGYEILPAAAGGADSYATYRDTTKPARTKMIYVSANDGMVHGFDATPTATGGIEKFAFVPNAALSALKELASPSYTHRYIVDGPLVSGDAYLNGDWKTVLVGTTGAAATKAVFALDVSSPNAFTASDVMWEFKHADLGYPLGQPGIARLPNGRWAAIFGNGYESTAGKAKLFIVYLNPTFGSTSGSPGWTAGTDFCVLDTDTSTANGLSTPALLDSNKDGVIDLIYAGDIQGNVWKFALNGTGAGCPSGWAMDKKVFQTPLVPCKEKNASGTVFNCTSPVNKHQPITSSLEITNSQTGQTGGFMLLFGTGMYYQEKDINDMTQQSFYGIWDDLGSSTVALGNLAEQTIDKEGVYTSGTISLDYRLTSANEVTYPAKKGWYMDLLTPNPTASTPLYYGERVVSAPLLRAGRVVFVTLTPSTDSCSFGGSSWLMELDLATGKRLISPPIDMNNDGKFDNADTVNGMVIGGVGVKGIIDTPAVISHPQGQCSGPDCQCVGPDCKCVGPDCKTPPPESKCAGTSGGGIQCFDESTSLSVRRTSWRQLQ